MTTKFKQGLTNLAQAYSQATAAQIFKSIFWQIVWISGIVLAKGFWSTFFAVITFGFWSFYLVIETIFIKYGVL